MFMGIGYEAWAIIGVVCLIVVVLSVIGWYVAYVMFDWAVGHVKHVWLEEPTAGMKMITEKEYDEWQEYISDKYWWK